MSVPYIFDEYAQKVADVSRVPLSYVLQLRDMGLIDHKSTRDMLIRSDYKKLFKTKKFTKNQILEKLAGIYDVDKRKVQAVVQAKQKKLTFCSKCGSPTSRLEHIRNDGICDKCFSKLINL